MTPAAQETIAPATSRGTHRMLVALVMALLLVGAGVSYIGIQRQPLPGPEPAPAADTPTDPVVRIDLPHEKYSVPPGPNRERFQVSCTICHSPRLAFTQPLFPEKKWQEVVHKMVAVYGAPLSDEDEREIVGYLSTVHGPTPP